MDVCCSMCIAYFILLLALAARGIPPRGSDAEAGGMGDGAERHGMEEKDRAEQDAMERNRSMH